MHTGPLIMFLDFMFVVSGSVAAGYLWTHARSIEFAGAVRAVQLLSVGIVLWVAFYLADLVLHLGGPVVLDAGTLYQWSELAQHRIRPVSDVIAVGLMLAGFVILLRKLGALLARLYRSTDALKLELTSRDTLEAELKSEADLERAQRQSKSEFLLGLSHELQTPLNGILGLTSLLSNTDVDDEQRRLLTTLDQSAQAMLSRLSDVLDLSLLETGKVELRSAAFEPCDLVRSVIGLFEPLARERGLALSADCGPDSHQSMIGDPARIKQILTHLVSNAVKFTPEGSVEVAVTCERIDADHARLVFTVADTGTGMSAETLETARETRTLQTGSGSGIGLSICWRLVALMDGTLDMDSAEDQGTTVAAALTVQIEPQTGDPEIGLPGEAD